MLVFLLVLSYMKQLNQEYNDYELIYLAKEHHDIAYEILQQKYEPIIVSISKKMKMAYPNIGLELQDYVLEGKLALTTAIYNFNDNCDNLFYTYAIKCIRFALLSLIRKSKKDSCLNNALEWKDEIKIEKEKLLSTQLQIKEVITKTLRMLNPLEKKVVILKMKGYSYQTIADKLLIDKKKVDNILLKVRKIIGKYRKE